MKATLLVVSVLTSSRRQNTSPILQTVRLAALEEPPESDTIKLPQGTTISLPIRAAGQVDSYRPDQLVEVVFTPLAPAS